MGLLPNCHAVLAKHLLDQFHRHVLQRANGGDAEVAQRAVGFRADHGDFSDREGGQKMPFCPPAHVPCVVGFRLSRGHLRHGLAGAKPHGNGQARLADHALSKLAGELPAPEKPIHPAEVRVELVDGTFHRPAQLPARSPSRPPNAWNRISNSRESRPLPDTSPAPSSSTSPSAPQTPRLVTAGCHHASIARPPNQDGPAFEA